ncbi:MAG: hypothetical protein BMS9Abin05_2629 [Rhodothermia bacterium]|nr:MAG: hypothetical protein BMS9Abin05_2629 [Rhodothermia bacterium]
MDVSYQNICEIVEGIVAEHPTRSATLRFVGLAHRFASAYLSRRRISESLVGARGCDLAMDTIADLFARDSSGRFNEITSYYNAQNWKTLSDAKLWAITRRLVTGRVSDSVFRLYREADPSLARIIRNLKRAVTHNKGLVLRRSGNHLWISLNRDITDQNPMATYWPEEIFEAHLLARTYSAADITTIVNGVAEILHNVGVYRSTIQLTILARIIRSASARLNVVSQEAEQSVTEYSVGELSNLIDASIEQTRTSRYGFYVAKGRITEREYDSLFSAIREQLSSNYIGGDGLAVNNQVALARHIPSLTTETYRERYRNILEYMHRCTRDHLISVFQNDLDISAVALNGNE